MELPLSRLLATLQKCGTKNQKLQPFLFKWGILNPQKVDRLDSKLH